MLFDGNIGRPKRILCLLAIVGASLFSAVAAETNAVIEFPAPTQEQARTWYLASKSNYLAQVGNTTSAWKFAQACFEWAEFSSNDTQRATLAEEGIVAAKFAADMDPKNAAAHFYIAMNKGQLARTRSLGALALVKEMEESFLRSVKLNPTFD